MSKRIVCALAGVLLTSAPVATASSATGPDARAPQSAAAKRVVVPSKPRCVKIAPSRRICGTRFRDDWGRGWWSDPARFKLVHVRLTGDTELTVPFDDYKSFKGEGFTTIKAAKGFGGTFALPKRGARVPATVGVGRPIEWRMQSRGQWTTPSGTYDCGVREQPSLPPTSFGGVFVANQKRGTISVNWMLAPAGFRCPEEGPLAPSFDSLPSEATTVHYKASAFRNAELLKLPINIEWEGESESDGARLKLDWSGYVLLRRVHHRL